MSYLARFRSDISALLAAYVAATGVAQTTVSRVVGGYPNALASCLRTDIRVGTYDVILARFSAIWPDDLPWPEGVHRPEPALINHDDRQVLERGFRSKINDWPADKPWPADIPRPVASPKQPVSGQGA